MPGAIIIGAGPGVGTAIARRLARERLSVGLIARSEATIDAALLALCDVDALGVAADATDEVALRSAIDEMSIASGFPSC